MTRHPLLLLLLILVLVAPAAPARADVTAPTTTGPSETDPGPGPAPTTSEDAGESGKTQEEAPDQGEDGRASGPRARPDRPRAPLSIRTSGGVSVRSFDLGNLTIPSTTGGQDFAAPVRGQLTLPAAGRTKGLVLLNHLRAQGCSDQTFAYPCPAGTREVRYDRGMQFLADDLARRGYAVVAPDLSPVFVSQPVRGDYDTVAAGVATMTRIRDALWRAKRGRTDQLGPGLDRLDLGTAVVLGHSRSGYFFGPLAQAWGSGPTRVTGVFPLATAMDVDADREGTGAVRSPFVSPPLPDVPVFGLVGSRDADVPTQTALHLANYLPLSRRSPAAVAVVQGYGHYFFNRSTAALEVPDDRICDPEDRCPTRRQHEKLLLEVFPRFVEDVRLGRLPAYLRQGDRPIPTRIGGAPARLLVHTPEPRTIVLAPSGTGYTTSVRPVPATVRSRPGTSVSYCRVPNPQAPFDYPDTCPEPADGALASTGIRYLAASWQRGAGGISFDLDRASASSLNLAIIPGRREGARVTLGLTDCRGRSAQVQLSGDREPALRQPDGKKGMFPATLRVPVSAFGGIDGQCLRELRVGDSRPGTIYLRQIDLTTPAGSRPPAPGDPTGPPVETGRVADPDRGLGAAAPAAVAVLIVLGLALAARRIRG